MAWLGFRGYDKVTKEYTPDGQLAKTIHEYQPGKTLWDWLQLLAVLAIPVVVALVSISYSMQQDANNQQQHRIDLKIAQDNRQNDMQIAIDQQQEATLKAYLDDMSSLLLTYRLRESQPQDEVRQVAQSKTFEVLRRVSAERKSILLRFLSGTNLIEGKNVIIDLSGTDLSAVDLQGVDLHGAKMRGARLRGAQLQGALLSGAQLDGADLQGAQLENADLSNATLYNADLSNAILKDAKVTMEQLAQARSLKNSTMPDGSKHP